MQSICIAVFALQFRSSPVAFVATAGGRVVRFRNGLRTANEPFETRSRSPNPQFGGVRVGLTGTAISRHRLHQRGVWSDACLSLSLSCMRHIIRHTRRTQNDRKYVCGGNAIFVGKTRSREARSRQPARARAGVSGGEAFVDLSSHLALIAAALWWGCVC